MNDALVHELLNSVTLICSMYNFKIVASGLMFDLLNEFSQDVAERNVEAVLKILKICGARLRSEDPVAFKNFLVALNAKNVNAESSVRCKFMIETIYNIKNNKVTAIERGSLLDRLLKLMRNMLAKRNVSATDALTCSLDDIKQINTRGRWWVVGAAFVGN